MTTPIQRQAMELQDAIFAEVYYERIYLAALGKHNMSTASIDQSEFTDEQLVSMANTFWFALPDSPSIRREPFFQLCSIAEHCFDGPEGVGSNGFNDDGN